jgi:hypothetical protein
MSAYDWQFHIAPPFAGITRIRFEGSRRLAGASQPEGSPGFRSRKHSGPRANCNVNIALSDDVSGARRSYRAMKKLTLALLAALPLVGGCVAYVPPRPVYARGYYYGPRYVAPRVYVAPPPVYVAPPRVRVWW